MKFKVTLSFFLIAIFPVIWFMGLSSIYFHFIVLAYAIVKNKETLVGKIPKPVLFILSYIAVYVLSLLFNYGSYSLDRFFASIYNLSFWLLGFLIILNVRNSGKWELVQAQKYSKVILLIIASIGFLTIFNDSRETSLKSVLGLVINPDKFPQLIKDTLVLKIMAKDWFDGASSVRNSIFSPYSTATAALSLLLFGIITIGKKLPSIRFFVWFFVCLIAIFSTYSRLVIFLFMGYCCLLFLFNLKLERRLLVTLISLVMMALALPIFFKVWNMVNEMRQGSSDIRFLMYSQTIAYALENNIFYGVAVKDRSFFFIPLGSHSTYLGGLLKTGIFGLFALIGFSLCFWKRFLLDLLNSNNNAVTRALSPLLFIMTFFLAFEDIDAAQFVSVVYFYCIGIYFSEQKFNIEKDYR